tara:strand:- start:18 stop:257 length:240 start_codon:yes stop_codon:yes gene_type:complete
MEVLIAVACLSLLANLVLILMHKGIIKDKDKDLLPDELEFRGKRIKEELDDIVKAVQELGNQIGDLPDAAKGKTRKGRK